MPYSSVCAGKKKEMMGLEVAIPEALKPKVTAIAEASSLPPKCSNNSPCFFPREAMNNSQSDHKALHETIVRKFPIRR